MTAPPETVQLVERFRENLAAYRSPSYNETQLRREFLDPFFRVLGWDVDNSQGFAEAYKDVVHEDAVKVGGFTKAPDYSFRIGGTRKFFVEAKKPAINIKNDPEPAFQLRRYAWSAKLPVSILSDFEQFAVYDCRIRPNPGDKASVARIMLLDFEHYLDRWDEIASVFSKEAIQKGSFDKFAEGAKGKRGTAEVDTAFLKEIEGWRELLAKNIALRNPNLTQRELNFAVQRTIDRIVFLRICEARGIEDDGMLRGQTNGTQVYPRLIEQFERADQRYNSGLFHFRDESGQAEEPDRLTPAIKVDDKVIKEIITDLYYPRSPYEFAVLPADILGQVYEQFLGKVIRLTAGHQAKVEEKPEVRKAGGVYYTPTYIVDYIVGNTVGKLLEGKSPRQADKLRILDPACGSGSFLIVAYQRLLDWYLERYSADAAKFKKLIFQGPGGEWRLTTAERKRILLNNIYGVDIDPQAVEVTKLSLALKVLEGETAETLGKNLQLFRERALPDLGGNIKCGNSLIGSDFYEQQQMLFLDEEEAYRINMFDWEAEFAAAIKAGGFDAVIGNPPYIRIQGLKEWAPREVEFYKERYASASRGNYDIYVVFVEKGLDLLAKDGLLGFIVPNKFFNAQYGEPIRCLVAENKRALRQLVHFGANQVFSGATTYTCLVFLGASPASEVCVKVVSDLAAWAEDPGVGRAETMPSSAFGCEPWHLVSESDSSLFSRLSGYPKLDSVADIYVGVQTSADDVFIMDFVAENAGFLTLHSEALRKDVALEKALLHPIVSGIDVAAYAELPERQYLLFPYEVKGQRAELLALDVIRRKYPHTAEYLQENQKRLEDREKGKLHGRPWHGYIYLKNMIRQSDRKLCVPRLVHELCAAFDPDGSHYLDNVDVGGVVFKPEHTALDLRYLLALLNSAVLRWYFSKVSAPFRGGFLSANRQFLGLMPVVLPNLSSTEEWSRYERIVRLAQELLDLRQRVTSGGSALERTQAERRTHAAQSAIDDEVRSLYGLTDAEWTLVGNTTD
jgi:predicted type IV restriction endonuclease